MLAQVGPKDGHQQLRRKPRNVDAIILFLAPNRQHAKDPPGLLRGRRQNKGPAGVDFHMQPCRMTDKEESEGKAYDLSRPHDQGVQVIHISRAPSA